jgi:hypothetical protein
VAPRTNRRAGAVAPPSADRNIIEVDTQPGEYTEIKIILPRMATFIAESRGRA